MIIKAGRSQGAWGCFSVFFSDGFVGAQELS